MPSATSACAIRTIRNAISSRARARPRWCRPADILEYDLDSNPIVPPTTRPYSERVIHGEIFKARPDVNAVCHHHAPSIMPFAISGVPLVPVFHLGAAMGQRAPFWDSRDEFGDTNLLVVKPEEGASLARALGKHSIVVMRRHGATVVGGELRELVFRTIYSAKNAEHQLAAHMLGHVSPLTPGEAEMAGGLNLAPGPLTRAYEYWVRRLAEREGRPQVRSVRAAATAAAAAGAQGRSGDKGKQGAKKRSKSQGKDEAMRSFGIGACAVRARRLAGVGRGHAEDRDRADQQLGEPGADARRGRRHLQEAQSQDRSVRHAGRGRDHPGGGLRLGRSRRRRRRRRRDARVLQGRAGARAAAGLHRHRRSLLVREGGFADQDPEGRDRAATPSRIRPAARARTTSWWRSARSSAPRPSRPRPAVLPAR